jgi:hypothetical protein
MTQTTENDAPDWEARAVIAEARVAQVRDMFSETRWLSMSMLHLYQIRDRVLAALDNPYRVIPPGEGGA